mmetsp:Transcript_36640/g.105437  ORF Transcript_36640/g.105437 Transcript_36640/m.105437 type:complete len:300 (+) Transcript_36640:391-1290(+)
MSPFPSLSKDLKASQQSAVHVDMLASAAAARKSLYEIFPSPSVSIKLTKAVIFPWESSKAAISPSSCSVSPRPSRRSSKVDLKASIMSCLGIRPSPSLSIDSNCRVSSASFSPDKWSTAIVAAVRCSTPLSLKRIKLVATAPVNDLLLPAPPRCAMRACDSQGSCSASLAESRAAGWNFSTPLMKLLHSADTFGSESCHVKSSTVGLGPCSPKGKAKVSKPNAMTPRLQTSPRSVRCEGSSSGAEYSLMIRNCRDSFGGVLMNSVQHQSVITTRESLDVEAYNMFSGRKSWCTTPCAWA